VKSIATAVTLASLGAAALAGTGFGAVHGAPSSAQLEGFGGKAAAPAHVRPIWHERASSSSLRRVRCATAAAGDPSTCWTPARS